MRPQFRAGLVVWMVLSVAEQLRHISTLVFRRVPGSLGNGISYYGFPLSVGGVSVRSLGGMTPRWIHIIFGSIWLITAIVFACLAYDAHQAEETTLSRFSVSFPHWGTVQIMGVDLPATLTQMSQTNNANVAMLEDSIHRSSRLSFVLNSISFVAAIAGLFAQTGQYLHEQRKYTRRNRYAAHHKSESGMNVAKSVEGDAEHKDTHAA